MGMLDDMAKKTDEEIAMMKAKTDQKEADNKAAEQQVAAGENPQGQ